MLQVLLTASRIVFSLLRCVTTKSFDIRDCKSHSSSGAVVFLFVLYNINMCVIINAYLKTCVCRSVINFGGANGHLLLLSIVVVRLCWAGCALLVVLGWLCWASYVGLVVLCWLCWAGCALLIVLD